MIPAKTLPDDVLECNLEKLVAGNEALIECAKKLSYKSTKAFRHDLFSGKIKQFKLDRLKDDIALIKQVRLIEFDMIQHSIKIYHKFANILRRSTQLDEDDIEQEASCAILDAIYAYTDKSTKFSTFVGTAIKNQFFKVARQNGALGKLGRRVSKILGRVSKSRKAIGELAKDEDVFQHAELTEEEIDLYKIYTIKVVSGSQLCNSERDGDDDYSKYRADTSQESELPVDMEVMEAYKKAPLDDFERKVIYNFLRPYWGWQSAVARESHNPQTGKPYTRMGIQFVLERALKKIKATFRQLTSGNGKQVA